MFYSLQTFVLEGLEPKVTEDPLRRALVTSPVLARSQIPPPPRRLSCRFPGLLLILRDG